MAGKKAFPVRVIHLPGCATVINDLATPSNSVLVFDAPGASGACGNTDDVYPVVSLSATAATGAVSATPTQPVDAVNDASGALTALLLVNHGSPASVAVSSGTALASPTTIETLQGHGITNVGGGDFASLAVIPVGTSAVWLYRDTTLIKAVNLATPTAPVVVYTAADTDQIKGPALIDGTTAYVAMIDTTNPSGCSSNCTNQIISIDVSKIATAGYTGQLMIQELSAGLQLLGVAGANLYYAFSDGSAIRMIPKTSATTLTASTAVFTPSGGSTLSLVSLSVPSPSPVVVGGGVYYTVYTAGPRPFCSRTSTMAPRTPHCLPPRRCWAASSPPR